MVAAPVDRQAVLASARPHGESRMLPATAYTDTDVLAWERRQLFAGTWTCVGRRDDLAAGGATAHALVVGDVGVLLTFSAAPPEGPRGPVAPSVRAFANVCRHRGHELLPADGTTTHRAVMCPYHGWAYRLDGALHTAPGMAGQESFDPAAHGLVELPAQEWHGWVFVNATGTAPPFDRYVGAMDEIVAPYQPGRLQLGARHSYEVAANWKIIVENYHECYHCPLIHPELCKVSPPTSGDNWDLPGAWVGGSMDLRDHAETMSLDGRSSGRMLPGVDPRKVLYLGLFPNLLISAHPDYVMAHRMEPISSGRTWVECSWFFPAGVTDTAYAVDFWDVTNREDWAACESVQRGVANPHFRPGPLAAREDAVYQWVSLVAKMYLDPAGTLASACRLDG